MKKYKEFMKEISDSLTRETSLLEMAIERKQIVRQVENLRYEIAVHIVKMVVLRNDSAFLHWAKEVNAWLSKIQGMVYDRKKRLTDDQYFSLLWEDVFFHDLVYDAIMKEIRSSHDTKVRRVEEAEMNRIKLIYMTVSRKISSGTFSGILPILELHA